MHTLGSKLTLLALHFPRLRVIWARSLHATADIFRALKANQDDPDPVEAQAVGKRSSGPPSESPHRQQFRQALKEAMLIVASRELHWPHIISGLCLMCSHLS